MSSPARTARPTPTQRHKDSQTDHPGNEGVQTPGARCLRQERVAQPRPKSSPDGGQRAPAPDPWARGRGEVLDHRLLPHRGLTARIQSRTAAGIHASSPHSSLTCVGGSDFAVGVVGHVVAVVVDASVVVAAEEAAVLQVGGAAVGPGEVVVGVGHRGWSVAVDGGAALVAQGHRDALGLGVEAALPADVEDLGSPPRTAGMIPAAQARRRASAAVIWPPVSRVATPAALRSASSCSNVMVTTMVAEHPPAWGGTWRGWLRGAGRTRDRGGPGWALVGRSSAGLLVGVPGG